MLQIRRIKPEDISFIMELASKNGYSTGKLLLNLENFLVCELDNIKCGCGCIVIKEGKGYVGWVMVSESHKRQKLGSAITKALLNIADVKGVKEAYATGICGKFLEKNGFIKQEDKHVCDEIMDVLGEEEESKCYRVSLEGYFTSCSH